MVKAFCACGPAEDASIIASGDEEEAVTKPRRLLFVEAKSPAALAEASEIREAGYEVLHAFSGADALSALAEGRGRIDLALIDIELAPGLGGPETARHILDMADIPIVFLVPRSERPNGEKAERIANCGYIMKGTIPLVMIESIEMALRLHEANAALASKDEQLEKYGTIFMASPFAIGITNSHSSRFIDVNEAFCDATGYSREEILGKTVQETGIMETPSDLERLSRRLHEEISLRNVETRYRRKNGKTLIGNAAYDYVTIGSERCVMSIIEDVTAERELDRELRESAAHYQALFNDLSEAVIEEDFSQVKGALGELASAGVGDLADYLCRHPGEVRRLVSLIRIVSFNQEFLRVSNVPTRSEIKDTLSTYVPDDTLGVLKDEILALASGSFGNESFSFKNAIPGSSIEYIKLRLSIVSGHESDWSSVLVSFTDVTKEIKAESELAASLKQKDILMKELEHRVKNNLNIVSSLLSLESEQIASPASKQIFLDAQSRIRSVSLIYDLLSHSSKGNSISCNSYLEELANLLSETYGHGGVRLSIRVPDFDIDVKRGVSLGLIVTELLTNSLKYAFPDKGGTVSLNLAIRDGGLFLDIEDDGVGAPAGFDWKSCGTLGVRIVDMLTEELFGSVEIIPRPGFSVHIRIPFDEPPGGR